MEGKNISVVLGRYHFSASRNGKLGRIAADGDRSARGQGLFFLDIEPFQFVYFSSPTAVDGYADHGIHRCAGEGGS